MSRVISTIVEGQTIFIEVDSVFGSEETSSAEETFVKANDAFEHAKVTIINVTRSIIDAILKMDKTQIPDELGLAFGIKFDSEGNAIVAKVGLEASLNVTLTYKNQKG